LRLPAQGRRIKRKLKRIKTPLPSAERECERKERVREGGVRGREKKTRQLSGRQTDARRCRHTTDLMCGGNKIFSKLHGQQNGVTAEMALYKKEKGKKKCRRKGIILCKLLLY